MKKCYICPRECNIESKNTFCKRNLNGLCRVAKAQLHKWEEPCISGTNGAGTVFFSGCNLSCIYCQNGKISHDNFGKDISYEKLYDIFMALIDKGAHNIELVTPTHYIGVIKKALNKKLPVPVIYNCGGYESTETLKSLEGLIDVYLPDMKYAFSDIAEKLSCAPDYPQKNIDAITEMYRQTGDCEFDSDGLIKKGVIVRHLVLPGFILNTKAVIKNFSRFCQNKKILFSLMAQYTPINSPLVSGYPSLTRTLTQKEYNSCLNFLNRFDNIEGFCQDLCSGNRDYIPDFDLDIGI